MGNIESSPEGSLGVVDSLKHRLQSLEEAIRSIEVAHQDAQGDHFPAPDSADVCLYGARLVCKPGVRILTGPVIGEVTANSVVILLEVDVAPELGPTANVSCYISLTDDACPRGRVVSAATLQLPSRRPRVFRFEGGPRNTLGPGRTYTACFGGVGIEDARFRVGRFRTPNTCFGPGLTVIAVSGDRPARLCPGEPSLWRMLREHIITAPSGEASSPPIDLLLHTGGQVWMADAFEDARELLRRRAMEPLLCAEGGWREAQEEATECLRKAVRRAWNVPDKRAVLSSVANIMLSGAADVHPELEKIFASSPSSTMGHVAGAASRQSLEERALHAAVRSCRRVYCEYQGQLLWKAVSSGEGRRGDTLSLTEAFEAEEKCVEEALAEAHRAGRDVAVKQKKVMIAEEALRRAKSAGSLPAEGGRRAAEDTIEKFRKDVKAAQARRTSLTRREVPAAAAAAAERASQGAFLNVGGSIGFVLLDTAWAGVSWDGGTARPQGNGGGVSGEEASEATPLLSHRAWETLEKQLSRDSELRLLIVVIRFALMGGSGVDASHAEHLPSSNSGKGNSAPREGNNIGGEPAGVGSEAKRAPSWLRGRDRFLNLLFKWKTAEAWREVVLVCGTETGWGGYGGLRSACELEIADTKHPGCTIRQLIAGPITDIPHPVVDERTSDDGYPAPPPLFAAGGDPGGRFSCRLTCIEDSASSTDATTGGIFGGDGSTAMSFGATATFSLQNLEVKAGRGEGAPGWDDGGGASGGRGGTGSRGPDITQTSPGTQTSGGNAPAVAIPRQVKAVSADGERSFLQASLYAGHSPSTAIAAGLDPTASARGMRASVVAEAVKLSVAGATVVLGPVVGRVTQRSAVVLVEAGSTAAVGCVLTDGVTGGQHRQTRLLIPGQPHAFFFETLEEQRHYTISLDGVDNADSRTGGFTTLKAWSDRREPPALRAALRLAAASTATAASTASTGLSQSAHQEKKEGGPSSPPLSPSALPDGTKGDASDSGHFSRNESSACDVRLLFVSGAGLADREARGTVGGLARSGGGGGMQRVGGAPPEDMWKVLGRELWNPWPQADVVVHTGSQVDLEVAVLEALPLLSAAEAEEEGSDAREEAEEMAMERIRDAYRFQWSLPGARACLSCGSHLMLRGEADLALPQLDLDRSYSSASRGGGGGRGESEAAAEEGQARPPGVHVSAYARLTLSRLASQAFSDYQRQLWDPLSVPMGLDMDDIGYARGGSGIDSVGSGGCHDGTLDTKAAQAAGMGEWHFHVFGETVGLFALDVRQGSSGLQQDQRAPVLSDAQWSSLALALSIEDIQAMVIVGDTPFVTDSIHDARAKARYPSNTRLRRSWAFHGGELLRFLTMLMEWKTTGAVGREPREVILIGGGLRCPLETVINDSLTSTAITQTICGPFSGAPLHTSVPFEFIGQLSQRLSYCHTARSALHEGQQQSSDQSTGRKDTQTPAPPYDTPGTNDTTNNDNTDSTAVIEGSSTSDADDCGQRPSLVLVRCEASGAGPSARLLLRSRLFTPASWTAWCGGGFKGTPPSAFNGSTEPLPSSQQEEALAEDFGRPRGVPQWAATAGGKGKGTGRPGYKQTAGATTEALAALAARGPAKVLAEAFERVLDVEEDDGDETSAGHCGGTGDASRRVFECVAWAYDHAACARVRAVCPTRPSPIVIRRFILAQQGGDPVDDHRRNKARADGGRNGGKTKAKKVLGVEEGGTENGGGRGTGTGTGRGGDREGRRGGRDSLASPAWLFLSLPFYDDDTFARFFGDVLQSSKRLANRFS